MKFNVDPRAVDYSSTRRLEGSFKILPRSPRLQHPSFLASQDRFDMSLMITWQDGSALRRFIKTSRNLAATTGLATAASFSSMLRANVSAYSTLTHTYARYHMVRHIAISM
jgi:hypothetical protein